MVSIDLASLKHAFRCGSYNGKGANDILQLTCLFSFQSGTQEEVEEGRYQGQGR